ncbi:uncharacterized protein PRCAT00000291001 [Priceomyces carsonii]|uniref:uncharacterized protein n=1 Tax=Priceomyces carsonii TaxID=28549 RepID=UPI002ED8A2F7|nr:unnamed protein product [Priceomyces carsonii]
MSKITPLSKSLIQICGIDATKFLNGLVTTRLLPNVIKKKEHTFSEQKHAELTSMIDIHKNWGLMHEDIFDPQEKILVSRDGDNSMFLNSKGRVVTDCFLYSIPFHNINHENKEVLEDEPRYLVEVDTSVSSQLLMMLKLHKLSSDVSISMKNTLYSYYYYNDSPEFDEWLESCQDQYFVTPSPLDALDKANSFVRNETIFNKKAAESILGFAIDNRIPNFGIKFISTQPLHDDPNRSPSKNLLSLSDLFSDLFRDRFSIEFCEEEEIKRRRYANGLFEVSDAMKGTSLLPFECNLDYTNGLCLDKGCYVGQELTIRTYNNGTIRKRIVPVQFFSLKEGSVELIGDQDFIEISLDDPVIMDLQQLSPSIISKMDVFPLNNNENEKNSTEDTIPSFASSPFGASSRPVRKRNTSSGKLLSIENNTGFMLISLLTIKKNDLFKVEIPSLEGGGSKTLGCKVFIPDWWPEEFD